MVGLRRTPIDRSPKPVLDFESVRMFKRGTKLMSEGREDEPEFRKISLGLHRRLGLKPWHQNVFDVDDAAPDDPHQFRDWKYVTSLRAQLAELTLPRHARENAREREAAPNDVAKTSSGEPEAESAPKVLTDPGVVISERPSAEADEVGQAEPR